MMTIRSITASRGRSGIACSCAISRSIVTRRPRPCTSRERVQSDAAHDAVGREEDGTRDDALQRRRWSASAISSGSP